MKTARIRFMLVLALLMALPTLADSHPEEVTPAEYNRRLQALVQDLGDAPASPSYPFTTRLEGSTAYTVKALSLDELAQGIRSKSLSHKEVYVSFTNRAHQSQSVSWIDTHGRRVVYLKELKPGQTFRHRSFPGHVWLMESVSGQDTALFQITDAIEYHIEVKGFSYERVSPDAVSSGLKSKGLDHTRIDVVLVNNTSQTQTVSWIDFSGNREVLDESLEPGGESHRRTYAGHYMLVENATSGRDTVLLRMRKH